MNAMLKKKYGLQHGGVTVAAPPPTGAIRSKLVDFSKLLIDEPVAALQSISFIIKIAFSIFKSSP